MFDTWSHLDFDALFVWAPSAMWKIVQQWFSLILIAGSFLKQTSMIV